MIFAAGPITIGALGDIYHYLSSILRSDGKLDLTGGALTNGQGQILQFQVPHGPVLGVYTKEDVNAALSGATSNIGTNFIPAGTMPLLISLYNTIAITGAASYTAGDGTTADLFGTGLPLTVGDSGNVMKNTTSPKWYTSAANLVLTATTSNFTAGGVRAGMVYLKREAMLS